MSEICGHIGGDASGAIATVCQQPKGHTGKHGGMGCEWDHIATPGRILGDKGQRFEVRTHPAFGNGKDTAGWHESLAGASELADTFVKHPEVTEAWVVDRANRWNRVYETRKPTRWVK